MGTKSKLFRVFVEGETISDGRTITAQMIDECVETFDTDTYTPRINIEHIAGYSPEPPFNGYGDVVAVEARTDEFRIAGKAQKRRALYAQVDGNDQLVGLASQDQKPFPSVELTPSYAGCGKVGLIGLAFTDTPASIGTQRLQFSHRAPGTFFASSTERVPMIFERTADGNAGADDGKGIAAAIRDGFSAVAAMFAGKDKADEQPKDTPKDDPKSPANDNDLSAFATAIGGQMATSLEAALKPVLATQATMQSDFAALKASIETTEKPDQRKRSPATGGKTGDFARAEC